MPRWSPWLLLLPACAGSPDGGGASDVTPGYSRVLVLADPHVIGDDYECCESPGLDTESIYRTRRRLETVGELAAAIDPIPERGFVLGDVFHDGLSFDVIDDYLDPAKGSAPWRAKEILDGFPMPVELLWGNHDYQISTTSREFAHEVFRAVFDQPPYHAVDVGPYRFLLMNSQLGRTWDRDPMNAFFDNGIGSFGREQLLWAADQLAAGKPTFLMFHHPPVVLEHQEDPDGPYPDVQALVEAFHDKVAGVFVGHMHRWIEMTPAFDVPTYVMGSTRYDADNFWVFDLDDDGGGWTILDRDKAAWGTTWGQGATYEDGGVVIDTTADPEEDPAGPWDGWTTPPPWPP